MSEMAIEATGLTKKFGNVLALDGVDISVPVGSVLGLLGPNGAGKTTAVRILTTIIRPDSGSARVLGYDVVATRPPSDTGSASRGNTQRSMGTSPVGRICA